jgi:hypothetical protein
MQCILLFKNDALLKNKLIGHVLLLSAILSLGLLFFAQQYPVLAYDWYACGGSCLGSIPYIILPLGGTFSFLFVGLMILGMIKVK